MSRSKDVYQDSGGYILVGVLILLSLGIAVTVGMLDSAESNLKTRSFVKTRGDQYYEVEETLNKTVTWLQTHSKYIVSAFIDGEFEDNFDTALSPSEGANEGNYFGVPTMVKLDSSANSGMLSNNAFFGAAAFPQLEHIDDETDTIDAVSAFSSADLGSANARVVLMWANETVGAHEPIFRIDVVTGNNPDRGVHSYAYVFSKAVGGDGIPGFYGGDYFTAQNPNNDCTSFKYEHNGSSWNRGAPRSNCSVGSDGPVNIASSINGDVFTLQDGGVSLNPPGGEISGTNCSGAGCHSFALPSVDTWDVYCPAHDSDAFDDDISSDTTWAAGGCWRDVEIDNNDKLTLTDYTNPYYFRTLTWGGNNSELDLGSIPPGEDIVIYVNEINGNGGNHINGKKLINGNNAPHQLKIYWLSATTLTLNGNVSMGAQIIAPNALVRVNGNFSYYGGIVAKELEVNGNAKLNYDEELGVNTDVADLAFSLKKASQRYR